MYFVIIASLLCVFANYLVQKWVRNEITLVYAMMVYTVASLCWAYSQKHFNLARGVVLYMMVELLAALAMGVLLFGQRLTYSQWFGVALGVGSVILITGSK